MILGGSLLSQAGSVSGGKTTKFQFSNSCTNAVQQEFNRGVRLLHSFEYIETAKIFSGIIEKDPDCAMAYWGAAMSIWHPLWAPPDKAGLYAGAKLLKRAAGLTATIRERAYLDALATFFSSTDVNSNRVRVVRYSGKMNDIYQEYRDGDVDATVFYALSLLGSVDPRDQTYKNQYKSGALLNFVRQTHPTHPGVLHYTIHSYDFPGLSHLALDAAKDKLASDYRVIIRVQTKSGDRNLENL